MANVLIKPDAAVARAKMRRIYAKAEQDIITEITRKRALEYVDYAEVASLERVQAILTDMQEQAGEYIPQYIEKIFYSATEKDASGYKNARALTSTQTNIEQQLVNNLMGSLMEASAVAFETAKRELTIGRLIEGEIREAQLTSVLNQKAAGLSWRSASKNMKIDLQQKGITSFVDKAGREWSLTDYCDMCSRTVARQAEVAAALTADDWDLWQISSIGSTCKLCATYEGRVYSKSGLNPDYPPLSAAFGKIDVSGGNDLANTYLNIHPNCLVPGGSILAEGVMAESRRLYCGEVITLKTAGGNQITVTPNHPILTNRGFVAAGLIKEGDKVIEARRKYRRLLGKAPNNINVPTVVDEVLHARLKAISCASRTVKGSTVQFHGDGGTDSEVNVIFSNGLGISIVDALGRKPGCKNFFPSAHGRRIKFFSTGTLFEIVKRALQSLDSVVSRLGFVFRGKGISENSEKLSDLRHRTTTGFGNLRISKTLVVEFKEFVKLILVKFPKGFGHIIKALSAGCARGLKFIFELCKFDIAFGDIELFGDLPSGETKLKKRLQSLWIKNAFIESRVTHVSTSFYDGYVYNLETKYGFYVYNNIVTHNCLHSLMKYTTMGKTEEQIQRDKDFSSFEKRPETADYRSKKQRDAYRQKEANRAKLLSDRNQWQRYQTALGKDIPGFEAFRKNKINNTPKYQEWESKYRSFRSKTAAEVEKILEEAQPVQTIESLSVKATDRLKANYELNRVKGDLNLVPVSEVAPDIVGANYSGLDIRAAESFDKTIGSLMEEYDTPLSKITTMQKEEAFFNKSVPASTIQQYETASAEMRINQNIFKDYDQYIERVSKAVDRGQFPKIDAKDLDKYVPTHEFAHSMMSISEAVPTKRNWTKKDFTGIKKAGKEVQGVFERYKTEYTALNNERKALEMKFIDGTISEKEVGRLKKLTEEFNVLKISDRAMVDVDEFFAEAFTEAKIGTTPSPYSNDILGIAEKYFGRKGTNELANFGKSGIIKGVESQKINLQFFAKIPEEKLSSYSLDFIKQPDKAKAFKEALGYTKENMGELKAAIEGAFDESKLKYKGTTQYGDLYEQVFELVGPNGKKANVLSSWIKKPDEDYSMTSVYVTKKKVTK